MIAIAILLVLLGPSVPDPRITTGVVTPMVIAKMCATKWGLDARHVTPKMKSDVCAAYKVKSCPGPKWEIDHLIPRELGGADVVANLWPQPIAEARKKDRLENAMRDQVCAGKRPLSEARSCFTEDWRACYQATFGTMP